MYKKGIVTESVRIIKVAVSISVYRRYVKEFICVCVNIPQNMHQ